MYRRRAGSKKITEVSQTESGLVSCGWRERVIRWVLKSPYKKGEREGGRSREI